MGVHREVIRDAKAWTSRGLGGRDGIAQPLTAEQLAGFDGILARTRHLAPQAVTHAEFRHPAVDALAAGLRRTIVAGRGAVLLTGLDRGRYSEDDCERIYWGIGTHLGDAAVQSGWGDRLGHVRHEKDDPVGRAYRSNEELTPHTDSYRIVGLMCLERAAEGGLSRLVSSLAIHNEILARRPDLLEPLYEGYHYAMPEARHSADAVTRFKIPVFESTERQVSCCYVRFFMEQAARARGEALPERLVEAFDLFDALALRDDLRLEFMLQPGEMLLWHNFAALHARTAFVDSPERSRHLLRLWLNVENDRPLSDAMLARGRIYDQVYRDTLLQKAPA